MFVEIALIGALSAFALGPASFNIIRNLINSHRWPWKSIFGFLVADVIYMILALALLRTPWLQESAIRTTLTALTAGTLLMYSLKTFFTKNSRSLVNCSNSDSFLTSLTLTLSNFHLVLIYAGLFSNLKQSQNLAQSASVYLLFFVGAFLLLLWGLEQFRESLKTALRKIELTAAYGFLGFAAYLSIEILR